MNDSDKTMMLSERDAQWLAGVLAVATTLLNPMVTDAILEHNLRSLEDLFDVCYSKQEAVTLHRRIAALLPFNSALHLHWLNDPMPPSTSSLVS